MYFLSSGVKGLSNTEAQKQEQEQNAVLYNACLFPPETKLDPVLMESALVSSMVQATISFCWDIPTLKRNNTLELVADIATSLAGINRVHNNSSLIPQVVQYLQLVNNLYCFNRINPGMSLTWIPCHVVWYVVCKSEWGDNKVIYSSQPSMFPADAADKALLTLNKVYRKPYTLGTCSMDCRGLEMNT